MINKFFEGTSYLAEGFRLVLAPGLRWFLLVPIAANIALFVLLFMWAKSMYADGMTYLMSWVPEWLAFMEWAFWLVYIVAMIMLMFYAFVSTANLIGAPFYGFLAEIVEQRLTGEKSDEPMNLRTFIAMIPRTIFREIRKLMYYLPRVIALSILGFVPGVNAIVAVVWIIFSGWMMAVQYVDYPADNKGVSFDGVRRFLEQHRSASLGFGLITFGLTLVPVVNLITLPAAVCGGVVFWVRQNANLTTLPEHRAPKHSGPKTQQLDAPGSDR